MHRLLPCLIPLALLAALSGCAQSDPRTAVVAPGQSSERQVFLSIVAAIGEGGKPDAALAFLDAYLAQYPDDLEARAIKGDALLRARDLRRAETVFKGLEAAGMQPQAAAGLGRLRGAEGRWPQAARQFATALDYRPADPMLLNNYGYARLQMGDVADARRSLSRAYQLRPDNPTIRNNFLLAGGDGTDAATQAAWADVPAGDRRGLRALIGNWTEAEILLDRQKAQTTGQAPQAVPAEEARKLYDRYLERLGQSQAEPGGDRP